MSAKYHVEYRISPANRDCSFIDSRVIYDIRDAQHVRIVSGDLLVDDAGRIVTDPGWLWEWERNDPNCYAQKAIRWQEQSQ